ncbi:MAG: hypothetical protein QX190_03150 [Methylococcales bacterium]
MLDFIVCDWFAWCPDLDVRDDRLITADNVTVPACCTPLARAVFDTSGYDLLAKFVIHTVGGAWL